MLTGIRVPYFDVQSTGCWCYISFHYLYGSGCSCPNGLGSRESDGCNQGIKCQWGIFEIQYILTQINFTVKAADALTYKLKTLTISGVHNKGTYGFDDSIWKSQEGTATYAHTIDDGALEVNTTGVEVNTAWMLMPQTLDTNAKINVVYDIYEKDVLLDTVTSAIDLNDTQAWGEGKKIRYTLTLVIRRQK